MPWLPIYADAADLKRIIDMLNIDKDVAFLIFDGHGKYKSKWKAVEAILDTTIARYCIWHIPSGPLPLLTTDNAVTLQVDDPWMGWEERRTGADSQNPYFGAGHVGIVWLNNRSNVGNDRIGLSSFEWVGNHYKVIGRAAPTSTEKWWKNLRKAIGKISSKIGRDDSMKPEIYCLGGAKQKLAGGWTRDLS